MIENLIFNIKKTKISLFNEKNLTSNQKDSSHCIQNRGSSLLRNFFNRDSFNYKKLFLFKGFYTSNYNDLRDQDEYSIDRIMLPRVYEGSDTIDSGCDTYSSVTGSMSPNSICSPVYIDEDVIERFIRVASYDVCNSVDGISSNDRRNDREEIRRRLAMGNEDDYYRSPVASDKPARKPSLQSRLQNGMNLQICFMNETASDNESTDSDTCPTLTSKPSSITSLSSLSSDYQSNNPYHSRPLSVNKSSANYSNLYNGNGPAAAVPSHNLQKQQKLLRPDTLSLGPLPDDNSNDFFTKQAKLQIEARMALSQAKDMARMQMEVERQKLKQSPITEVIRNALEKVGVSFPPDKRRLSRQLLTGMNIAQLQVIVNDLHTQIEYLNEHLMQFLMERDELRMSQDSMLVDIEDLTIYLGAKEETIYNKPKTSSPPLSSSVSATSLQTKPTSQQKLKPSSATAIGSGTSYPHHQQQQIMQQQNQGMKKSRSDSTSSIGSTISTGSNNSQSLQNKFFKMASLVRK